MSAAALQASRALGSLRVRICLPLAESVCLSFHTPCLRTSDIGLGLRCSIPHLRMLRTPRRCCTGGIPSCALPPPVHTTILASQTLVRPRTTLPGSVGFPCAGLKVVHFAGCFL